MTAVATRLVKVVVWDLDGTLWPGVALESDGLPAPYPADLMEAFPVSTAVNRAGRDAPEMVEPLPS